MWFCFRGTQKLPLFTPPENKRTPNLTDPAKPLLQIWLKDNRKDVFVLKLFKIDGTK